MLKQIAQYHRPATLEQALAWLDGELDGAHILAGGTELLASPGTLPVVVDITRLGLDRVEDTADSWSIGACCTLQKLLDWGETRLPSVIVEGAGGEIGRLLRNAATVGGCLAGSQSPQGLQTALLALDAEVEVQRRGGSTSVPLADLLADRSGLLPPQALITGVRVPRCDSSTSMAFERCALAPLDRSIVSACVVLRHEGERVTDARVALGSYGAHASRLRGVEAQLCATGKLDEQSLRDDLRLLSFTSDVRGSADYRAHLAGVLVRRCLGSLRAAV